MKATVDTTCGRCLGPAKVPVDWVWARPAGGRIFSHAGNDLGALGAEWLKVFKGLVEDPDRREELGENAQARARGFTWDHTAVWVDLDGGGGRTLLHCSDGVEIVPQEN